MSYKLANRKVKGSHALQLVTDHKTPFLIEWLKNESEISPYIAICSYAHNGRGYFKL